MVRNDAHMMAYRIMPLPHSHLILYTTSPWLKIGILSLTLPRRRTMVLVKMQKTRLSPPCSIYTFDGLIGSYGSLDEVIPC